MRCPLLFGYNQYHYNLKLPILYRKRRNEAPARLYGWLPLSDAYGIGCAIRYTVNPDYD